MRIARAETGGVPFWGIVDAEASTIRPVDGAFGEWAPALTRGEGESALRFTGETLKLDEVHLLAPIERHARVMIAGVNYTKHLVEFGVAPPSQPFAFLKAMRALTGPYDPIRYPPLTSELDHEVELVAVKGSVELAPLTGMVDGIVDLTATGKTLAENGLEVVEEIVTCTARLIANPVAHKLKAAEIDAVVQALRGATA